MLGELRIDEIDHLLHEEFLGHLGCSSSDLIFVVPITFAYDGKDIYAHSPEGTKVNLMRGNKNVCLEVVQVTNMKTWKSAIVWGEYEELTDKADHEYALQLLDRKIGPMASETAMPQRQTMTPSGKTQKSVVYRIKVIRKTGRYEGT